MTFITSQIGWVPYTTFRDGPVYSKIETPEFQPKFAQADFSRQYAEGCALKHVTLIGKSYVGKLEAFDFLKKFSPLSIQNTKYYFF